ncbi:MAG: InlB B-repeat-containing protein [Clostridia bacterium]|nr:InlB B-repeat-containing protein [Clostridia bacterium]
MKKLASFLSIILCLCMLLPAYPVTAAIKPADPYAAGEALIGDGETDYDFSGLQTYAIGTEPGVGTAVYSYNGQTTYTNSNCSLKWTVPNTTEGGNTMSAMQGLNVGTTYCYAAKIDGSDAYCDVTRINMNTGEKTVMAYYSSLTATSEGSNNTMGHANDITVVGINGVNYMYVATMKKGTAITRLKIDGTKLRLTGYFKLVNASGDSISVSAIKQVKVSGGYAYFLLKSGNTFYSFKVSSTANGGSASSPTAVNVYKLFTIDTRNAVFAKSNSSAGVYDNIESWTNQGFGYNKAEGVVYVPIWDSGTPSRNVVICYNVKDNIDTWLETTKNLSNRVYPSKTSFMIQNTSYSQYEIESVGFRTGQGSTGDLKMYYNTNCSSSGGEGVYSCSYTSGSGDMTSLADGQVLWTTKYNANGGSGSMSNTYHIRGISTKLRANAFTRSGYTFAGWNLTRKSDGKWLYTDADGTARWYSKGSQPATSCLALYSNSQSVSKLTGSNGDTVTCYAQWTPNSTGTTSFYIRYDANGGTGTMDDTKVVYGTSTTIKTNTFTRAGYVFSGWTAYRQNKAQWCYKTINAASISDSWLTVADDTTGLIRKTYQDGTTVAKTTSVDRDIVTFYATWTRVANEKTPASIAQGSAFSLGGTLESTSDMYTATVRVKNSAGTVVASHSASPLGMTYDLSKANTSIDFTKLAVGTYTYEVLAGFLNSSTPFNVTILTKSFTVTNPATLELTDTATATGNYTLGDKYFRGFGKGATASELKTLFKYDISITDASGKAVDDAAVLGTGWIISCNGESRTTVLSCDINGDAVISTTDYAILRKYIGDGTEMTELMGQAADANEDAISNTTDLVILRRLLES